MKNLDYKTYNEILHEADGKMKKNNGHAFITILKTRCDRCGRSPNQNREITEKALGVSDDWKPINKIEAVEKALDDAFRRGEESMRERAAQQAEAMRSKTVPRYVESLDYDLAFQHAAGAIRSLPIGEPLPFGVKIKTDPTLKEGEWRLGKANEK